MMLLRHRNEELDPLRTLHHGFNHAWVMFFGTIPPGIHPEGVRLSFQERKKLGDEVSAFEREAEQRTVEPFDPAIHVRPGVGPMYGSEK